MKEKTTKIGIDLSRIGLTAKDAQQIKSGYRSLNAAALSAILNWHRVRSATLEDLIDCLEPKHIQELKTLDVPVNCSPAVFIAMVEASGFKTAEILPLLDPVAQIVLVDLVRNGQLSELEDSEWQA